QITAKRSEAKSIDSYKESLERRKTQLLQENENLENNFHVYEKNLAETRQAKTDAESGAEERSAELEEIRIRGERQVEQNRQLSKRRELLYIQKSQLTSRKKTIEEMEHNYEGYHGAVRYIMQTPTPGICGVVADLMEVPDGYEIAIETALGASMQNIVCETD